MKVLFILLLYCIVNSKSCHFLVLEMVGSCCYFLENWFCYCFIDDELVGTLISTSLLYVSILMSHYILYNPFMAQTLKQEFKVCFLSLLNMQLS